MILGYTAACLVQSAVGGWVGSQVEGGWIESGGVCVREEVGGNFILDPHEVVDGWVLGEIAGEGVELGIILPGCDVALELGALM